MESSSSKPLKSIWILALGSRGDIQPYIAIGAELVKRGYVVTFFTAGDQFANFARSFGMSAVVMEEDPEEFIKQDEKMMAALAKGSLIQFVSAAVARSKQKTAEHYQPFMNQVKADAGPPDLCISMPITKWYAWYLAIQDRVPFLFVSPCVPSIYNPDRPVYGVPKLPFGLEYYLLKNAIGGAYDIEKAIDDALGTNVLQHYTKQQFITEVFVQKTLPEVCLLSPTFAEALFPSPSVRDPLFHFVGSAVIESKQQIDVNTIDSFGGQVALGSLISFLIGSEQKPVYLGWGSMTCRSPEYMLEMCVRAVHHAGQRAIILGGFAGLSMQLLESIKTIEPELVAYARTNILFVTKAPHEWLFPRVACTVHHGGAGTTAAALRAGIPTIITPVFGDQYDFSYAVRQLKVGVGFEKQFQQISWKELGEAIKTVLSDESGMAQRAAELGTKLQSENGAMAAANEIESYWSEYCQTGKFHELFPGSSAKGIATSSTALVASHRKSTLLGLGAVGAISIVGYVMLSTWSRRKPST